MTHHDRDGPAIRAGAGYQASLIARCPDAVSAGAPDPAHSKTEEAIVAQAQALHGEAPDAAPGRDLSAGADIVNRVLPDDPAAEAAVNRKAQALGIDIGQENWVEVCPLSLGLLIC